MSNRLHAYKSEIDDWASKWEDAVKNGIFPSEKESIPSAETAQTSFFGPTQSNPSELSDQDSEYWSKVSNLADAHPQGMISENEKKVGDMTGKDVGNDVKNAANPILPSSAGNDQTAPHSMGYTYSNDQLEELADLKVKLSELGNKLAEAAGKGLNFGNLEKQISEMQRKIDDLSDDLTQPLHAEA